MNIFTNLDYTGDMIKLYFNITDITEFLKLPNSKERNIKITDQKLPDIRKVIQRSGLENDEGIKSFYFSDK